MSTVYIIGAGFTRAVMGNAAPLNNEIMQQLDIAAFPEIHREYEETYPNTELFFSRIDLKYVRFCEANKTFAEHIDTIRKELVKQVYGIFDVDKLGVSRIEDNPALHSYVNSIPPKSHIISLNYDCVLDQGLWLKRIWHYSDGYCIDTRAAKDTTDFTYKNIFLLKPHGSCNFRMPLVVEGSSTSADNGYPIVCTSAKYFKDSHSHLNENNKPYLLVPSYMKSAYNGVMMLWREAINALASATNLVIIGCSVRPEDTFLRYAIYHFGLKDNCESFFIDVIDLDEEKARTLCERIKGLVAWPNKHQIVGHYGGLEHYLDEDKRHQYQLTPC